MIFQFEISWILISNRQIFPSFVLEDRVLPVHVLRMMQWSMMGLQFTVISKQWCALWCWADLSSGLNCRADNNCKITNDKHAPWKREEIALNLLHTTIINHKSFYPDSHKSNISILWALHENKSGVSGVLYDDFLCNLSRSCKNILTV